MHEKYSRNADDNTLMFSKDNSNTKVTFEKFLTDIASGYLSGTPVYSVASTGDEQKDKLIKELFDKDVKDDDYKKSMEIIISYVTSFNDDETEHHDLIHDILELTSCYEILYENENNDIIYSKYDPLTTVAIWDYNIPANLIGLVRVWNENDINDKVITKCELTDKYGTKTYSLTENYEEVTEIDNQNHNWGDVPAIAVETDYAIFEPCEDIISSYEQLVQNVRNTFQYNDSDCKMKFVNYRPENPITIVDEVTDDTGKHKVVKSNPAREVEDDYILKARTLYIGENGDANWIMKPLDSAGVTSILKMYTDLMFQLAGIPNTSDLAFNSADLNASAIDRKFYIMNMMTANIISELKKAYLRRWELIFNRINLKKDTNFDFRDVSIELPKNLPSNSDEMIDSMLKLQNILSEQTIIEKLGYDYQDEKTKKDEESTDNMLKNIERMEMLGTNVDNTTIQEQTGKEEIKTDKSDDEIIKEVDDANEDTES